MVKKKKKKHRNLMKMTESMKELKNNPSGFVKNANIFMLL